MTALDPELAAEYNRARLMGGRALIRMACLLGLVMTLLRIGEIALRGAGTPIPFAGFPLLFAAVVLSTSTLLAWLAWSPSFPGRYLAVANIAVPVRSAFVAFAIAAMASRGQVELLMVLPLLVLSPYFFMGLHLKTATACVALTMVSFAASAMAFGLPVPVLLRASGFLLLTAVMSAVAAWHLEQQSRRSFLEGRLIAKLAEHDALTGAKNRRVFDGHLARLWQQAIRDGRRIAILLIDVDHFKAFNDRYGHQAGDSALQGVANTVQLQIARPLDMLARYGGEEFAVLLYDVDPWLARKFAERMRAAVAALGIEHRGARAGGVLTISIGVAAIQPVPGRAPVGALQLADEALYAAKVRGRDSVHLASDADYSDLTTGVFAQCVNGPVAS